MDSTTQLAEQDNHASVKFHDFVYASSWTDEQYTYLKKLWGEGHSGAITAERINSKFGTCYTRSAVIGKVNRGGLTLSLRRAKYGQPSIVGPRYHAPLAGAPTVDDNLIPFAQRKTMLDLDPGDCKWPIGDPSTPDFFFCGAVALKTSPYCHAHHGRSVA